MSLADLKTYYVTGLHALRSASEQGAESAHMLAGRARDADLKQIVCDYQTTAARHQERIVGFMDELDVRPNGFKDRVLEGIGKGTDEMLKAGDRSMLDLGVVSGSATGVQYFSNAFASQMPTCSALGLEVQGEQWKAMAREWQDIEKRLGAVAGNVVAAVAQDDGKAA